MKRWGFTESYNVSVACALMLQVLTQKIRQDLKITWQLDERKRQEKKLDWIVKSLPNGEKMLKHYLEKLGSELHQKK